MEVICKACACADTRRHIRTHAQAQIYLHSISFQGLLYIKYLDTKITD